MQLLERLFTLNDQAAALLFDTQEPSLQLVPLGEPVGGVAGGSCLHLKQFTPDVALRLEKPVFQIFLQRAGSINMTEHEGDLTLNG